ncbi:NfeD family protein [uncultured Draconibacterium sp.]|uniref:NfeD family protein n=1 Tax=uncultured Draconibacterium sp. TaxID=1573823 RepID=UPI0025FDC20E|nr:NfeD family protein [uncultured Draconibacterium sp.]
MSILAIILLILLGLVLLLIEFAVIPGVTIAGIGGFLLLGGAVYVAFAEYGTLPGFITLALVLILAPALVYYFFKSRTGKKMILEKNISGKVDLINREKVFVGDTGKAIGRLAPMGKVKVNGEIIEAQSTGAFIDHNTEIKVLKIESNKIIVEPLNK